MDTHRDDRQLFRKPVSPHECANQQQLEVPRLRSGVDEDNGGGSVVRGLFVSGRNSPPEDFGVLAGRMKSKPLKASDNTKQSDSIDGVRSVGERRRYSGRPESGLKSRGGRIDEGMGGLRGVQLRKRPCLGSRS